MSNGARLTNIASGLCGAFGSRNNDLDGYWSIGKLRSLAMEHDRTTIVIDLLDLSMQPSSSASGHVFAPVLARYRCLLAKLAGLTGIPFDELTAARITVDFAPPPWPRTSYYTQQWGDQFVLTVAIHANGRTAGIVRHAGYCRPHDPACETRSTRPANCQC